VLLFQVLKFVATNQMFDEAQDEDLEGGEGKEESESECWEDKSHVV